MQFHLFDVFIGEVRIMLLYGWGFSVWVLITVVLCRMGVTLKARLYTIPLPSCRFTLDQNFLPIFIPDSVASVNQPLDSKQILTISIY